MSDAEKFEYEVLLFAEKKLRNALFLLGFLLGLVLGTMFGAVSMGFVGALQLKHKEKHLQQEKCSSAEAGKISRLEKTETKKDNR